MIRTANVLVFASLLTACVAALEPDIAAPVPQPPELGWMEGCWITEDGSYREVWQRGGEDLLFGYATLRHDGEVVFFEQTRIETDTPAFYAYPAGVGPSPFPMISMSESEAVFLNATHDYPQRIRYAREGTALVATISLADGSRASNWAFQPCSPAGN